MHKGFKGASIPARHGKHILTLVPTDDLDDDAAFQSSRKLIQHERTEEDGPLDAGCRCELQCLLNLVKSRAY